MTSSPMQPSGGFVHVARTQPRMLSTHLISVDSWEKTKLITSQKRTSSVSSSSMIKTKMAILTTMIFYKWSCHTMIRNYVPKSRRDQHTPPTDSCRQMLNLNCRGSLKKRCITTAKSNKKRKPSSVKPISTQLPVSLPSTQRATDTATSINWRTSWSSMTRALTRKLSTPFWEDLTVMKISKLTSMSFPWTFRLCYRVLRLMDARPQPLIWNFQQIQRQTMSS